MPRRDFYFLGETNAREFNLNKEPQAALGYPEAFCIAEILSCEKIFGYFAMFARVQSGNGNLSTNNPNIYSNALNLITFAPHKTTFISIIIKEEEHLTLFSKSPFHLAKEWFLHRWRLLDCLGIRRVMFCSFRNKTKGNRLETKNIFPYKDKILND